MSKLFIFGIGGTGARVLRALTMLLASGVECNDDIVPIIIDPDSNNGDLTRTISIMQTYKSIRKKLSFNKNVKNKFFKTELIECVQNFQLQLNNTQNCTFEQYMNVPEMSLANQALIKMLFSEKNLASDMQVGFKGNPNIGSIVLNQFSYSPEFKEFANSYSQNDKIFIISSIFGGTGASGFPLLLKTLRTNKDLPNHALLNNALIGAITVLPYFKIKQNNDSAIESDTFISKTKSALSYYYRNISNNNSIDMLYYIGDNENTQSAYENEEGGNTQMNKAHCIELFSALAILDFSNSSKEVGSNTNHKEFGIRNDTDQIIFSDLGPEIQDLICKPLVQFFLYSQYQKNTEESIRLSQQWSKDRKMDKTFFRSEFIKNVNKICYDFEIWLKEMAENKISFSPFSLNGSSLFEMVNGISPKKLLTLKKNYELFDDRLDKVSTGKGTSLEEQFIELFYKATDKLAQEKLKI